MANVACVLSAAFAASVAYDGLSQWTNNRDIDQLRTSFDDRYDIEIFPFQSRAVNGDMHDLSFIGLVKKGSHQNEDRIGYALASRTFPYSLPTDTGDAAKYNTQGTLLLIHRRVCDVLQNYRPTPPSWYVTPSVQTELHNRQEAVANLIKTHCQQLTP